MTNNDPIILTNIDRRRFALVSLKGRLKFEIRTGMKATSRGSTLEHCFGWGYEGPRRKDKALIWVEAELTKYDEQDEEGKVK